VRSADPAHKRVVAEAVVEKQRDSKQKRKPRPDQQAPQKRAKAGSTCPGVVKRAAKTAGVSAEAPPSKPRSDRKPGRKPSGTSKAAAGSSAASGGAQKRRASGGSAAAKAAKAAARREAVRWTGERVEEVCLEADDFCAQYEDVGADEILDADERGYDSDLMV